MKRSFAVFVKRLGTVGLHKEVEAHALALHVSLRELYEGPDRAPSIVNARQFVYAWLLEQGKGNNEIARLFDRAPSGVLKLTGGRKMAASQGSLRATADAIYDSLNNKEKEILDRRFGRPRKTS